MNGVWSWQVVHAAGGVHVKLLPCRTEKLAHWLICPQEGLGVVEATLVHLRAAIFVFCVGLHRPGAAATISWAAKVEQAAANVNPVSRRISFGSLKSS